MASLIKGDREDDLALFHGMQRRDRPVVIHSDIYHNLNNTDPYLNSARISNPSLYRMATSTGSVYRGRTSGEELLASDTGKNDYDWLLTPPGTPLVIAGPENEPVIDSGYDSSQKGFPNLVKSLATMKTNQLSRGLSTTSRFDAASRMTRGNVHSSANAPNRRSSLAPSAAAPSARPASRPSTLTSRPMISSTTKISNGIARSSTISPTSTRSAISSRSTTPLRRPSTPTFSQGQVAPGRSASASKASSSTFRSAPATRGSSPTTRTQAWKPSAMPGFSLEPPPNLRTTLPARSISNSRGASVASGRPVVQAHMDSMKPTTTSSPSLSSSRPGSFSSPSLGPLRQGTLSLMSSTSNNTMTGSSKPRNLSSRPMTSSSPSRGSSPSFCSTASLKTSELVPDRSRRQSCSPSITRERTSTPERTVSRNGRSSDSNINGTVGGRSTKMVDRMTQSRRVVASATSPGELPALQLKCGVKPTTPTLKANSFSGKNYLPRKSIDMALRQMDIRQSVTNARTLVSNTASLALYSTRSSNARVIRQGYSPVTTSSIASSEHSMSIVRDLEGSEVGEDACSEVGSKASPRMSSWNIDSPDYREDSAELMQVFSRGVETRNCEYSDSPIVSCERGNENPKCELWDIKNRLKSLKASPMSAESMRLSPYSCSSSGAFSPS